MATQPHQTVAQFRLIRLTEDWQDNLTAHLAPVCPEHAPPGQEERIRRAWLATPNGQMSITLKGIKAAREVFKAPGLYFNLLITPEEGGRWWLDHYIDRGERLSVHFTTSWSNSNEPGTLLGGEKRTFLTMDVDNPNVWPMFREGLQKWFKITWSEDPEADGLEIPWD